MALLLKRLVDRVDARVFEPLMEIRTCNKKIVQCTVCPFWMPYFSTVSSSLSSAYL